MAMEKLMLKSLMYGVDKVPDTWFDKLPGGFYKAKQEGDKEVSGSGSSQKKSNTNDKQKDRNKNDRRDDRYRSDGHRRRDPRSRSSYDGGGDDEDDRYYSDDDDRRRPRREKSRRRPHSSDGDRYGNDNRYGNDDRDRRPPREGPHARYSNDRRDGRPSSSRDQYHDQGRPPAGGNDRPPNPFTPGPYVDTGAAARAAPNGAPYPKGSSPQSPTFPSPRSAQAPQARTGSINTGYVPYAHIYGQGTPKNQQQPFSPPPPADGSRPNTGNRAEPPMSPPPQGYQQNQFAQQAPTAAAAGAGAEYNGQPGFLHENNWDPCYNAPRRRSYGYDENDKPDPDSPRPERRSSRRDYSPSDDSYDSRANDRRTRSERRHDDKYQDRDRERYADPRKSSKSQTRTQRHDEDRTHTESQRDGVSRKRDSSKRTSGGYRED